ncbi:MAG: ABC transporter ATP-binding protein [Gammaproteobacteria bacterium]|nr:MAG: ABC transporter ATP-binding protein [Gammaproteobacteria bacterium]PIE36871.1 MAG: ABC transporter ATP-binding protein [Gammaproteobacteria bacterium]
MIRLVDVCKSYRTGQGRKVVLDRVSADFPVGKSIGILGLNGAGKSTLIRIIGKAEPPDRGRVECDQRISWPLGYAGGFVSTMTARENARFVARVYGEDIEYVEQFTREFSELGSYFDEPLNSYSAGMRGRFAFSVSLACNFEYYLVDEALETGDARYREKFRRAFEERRREASVILVSHNEQTIRRNCDMAAILHEGSLTLYADLQEALQRYNALQNQTR